MRPPPRNTSPAILWIVAISLIAVAAIGIGTLLILGSAADDNPPLDKFGHMPDQMTGGPWIGVVFEVSSRLRNDIESIAKASNPELQDMLMDDIKHHRSHHDRVVGVTCRVTEFDGGEMPEKNVDIRYIRTPSFDGEKMFYRPIYAEYGNQLILDLRSEPEVATVLAEWK
ncbi:hypothetical protein ACYFX5_03720 [Bremerella sp. T1]|uniref:hypothetical protein n=1 Tax=Bremerella sp. TYQ1 TaxID=3119568 RepID=UPI001CCD6E6E|nr:hypothetical protein [Bremerella volcania]UBM37380.1 hypothetical protein LA756_05675 [Bremerella volcania]